MYEKTTSTLKALFFTLKKTTKQETDRQTATSEERGGEGIYKSKEGLQFYDCIQTICFILYYYRKYI